MLPLLLSALLTIPAPGYAPSTFEQVFSAWSFASCQSALCVAGRLTVGRTTDPFFWTVWADITTTLDDQAAGLSGYGLDNQRIDADAAGTHLDTNMGLFYTIDLADYTRHTDTSHQSVSLWLLDQPLDPTGLALTHVQFQTYYLYAGGDVNDLLGSGNAFWDLTPTLIPEPVPLWLVAVGMLTLFRMRRS